MPEVNDVILVDLDGGHVSIPESVNLCSIPEPYLSRTRHALTLVLNPYLIVSDLTFPPHVNPSPLHLQDKEIRAIFMRLFAQIFSGYRSCLKVIRIHPQPIITFHKGTFMEKRGVFGDDFFNKVLDSISFNQFITERGPPHRTCDLFDELVASIDETLKSEMGLDADITSNIQQIAKRLYDNESNSSREDDIPSILPTMKEDPPSTFPILDTSAIEKHLADDEGSTTNATTCKARQFDKVPYGSGEFSFQTRHYINIRKLEVLHDCVAYIFENKISEARKALPSVQRALKSRGAQLALCQELAARSEQHRAVLEHDQFNLVITLMNCALQDDASLNDGAVASALLPLTSEFCRNLSPGVMQFAYTCVQDHPIWQNAQFWEETFFSDVQTDIKKLYDGSNNKKRQSSDKLFANHAGLFERLSTPRTSRTSITQPLTPPMPKHDVLVITQSGIYQQDKIDQDFGVNNEALDIAATQLRTWSSLSDDVQKTNVSNEESIVFSQAIHFVNRMVYLMIPLNVSQLIKPKRRRAQDTVLENTGAPKDNIDGSEANTSIGSDSRNNVAKVGQSTSGSVGDVTDAGTGVGSVYGDVHGSDHWDEDDTDTVTDEVTRFVIRFVDRVGSVAGISTEHLKSLYSLVPSVVTMHTESLEPVYREHKQLAPIRKAKIIRPAMLPCEELQINRLRCYLIPDGRETGTALHYGGPCLFPAEGAVFLTNYRIIFKGTPVDEFASEMVVTRSFPLGSLVREKKLAAQYLPHLNSWMQECVQLRSVTFQMLKLCFDEEVGAENVDIFRKTIIKLRYPPSVLSTFSFKTTDKKQPVKCVRLQLPPNDHQATEAKGTKSFPNHAAVKKDSGIRHIKGSIKRARNRNGVSSPRPSRKRNLSSDDSMENIAGGQVDLADIPISLTNDMPPDIDKLNSAPYCKEYTRLGFGSLLNESSSKSGPWRISIVNLKYAACRSYPAVLVVPHHVSDDSILRVAKNHRQMRFPVATWKNRANKAVLLRSSAIERSSVASIIRTGVAASGGSTDAIRSSNVEQDKYLSAVVSATPVSKSKATAKQQSLASNVNMSTATMDLRVNEKDLKRVSAVDTIDKAMITQGWEPAALYVFGDKSNLKNLKKESYPKIEFVPAEMPDLRDMKTSLKKLFKVCCPSGPPKDPGQGESFLKALQESEWFNQLSLTLRISGAIVDLLDIQGSSVLVSFEDGWDTTSLITSLAQVMLDPNYRTIDGFKVLIEKEWLSFGHRFSHRCNHIQSTQSSGFAPVFLQFLDGVHQILRQYPLSFEFNEYFLHFLAYHHVSMRFRTFLLDSEHERQQMGWLSDDEVDDRGNSKSRGKSLWDYVDELHKKSSLFYNFKFSKEHSNKVLRPHCNVSNLKLWSYFVSENVSTGPTFDQELINETETAAEEGQQKFEDKYNANRRCLSGMYGGTVNYDSSSCSFQLQEYNRIEEEADRRVSRWKRIWDKLEPPNITKKTVTFNTILSRHRSAALHKRDAMDIILKGKLQIDDYSQQGFTQPHTFEAHSFVTPTNCDFCLQMMWYIGKGGCKCKECGFNCHEKCLSRVPQTCRHYRNLKEQNANVPSTSNKSLHEPSSSVKSSKFLCGYLWKRGALFKQWKPRYFVLDTERHQLRYYDAEGDIHCQGVVNLSEIISCELTQQSASNEKQVYFDLRTDKRSYNLYASSEEEAKEWINRLQTLDT
ncbi:Myotubularin-related 13 [Paramuricea clavata]|nr:Myotubularin-related 13 [Paramuricea clavata]